MPAVLRCCANTEKRLGLRLRRDVARALGGDRRRKSVQHPVYSLLVQRVLGIALSYEDFNDHDTPRKDVAVQTATGRLVEFASPSTLGRLERRAERRRAWAIHGGAVGEVRLGRERVDSGELLSDY